MGCHLVQIEKRAGWLWIFFVKTLLNTEGCNGRGGEGEKKNSCVTPRLMENTIVALQVKGIIEAVGCGRRCNPYHRKKNEKQEPQKEGWGARAEETFSETYR